MNTGDIRYGGSPFPYGEMYDRGITLDKVFGGASDPRGLTEGVTYIAITLHKNYAEYAASTPADGERTIYIKSALLGDAGAEGSSLVTIRLGLSFQSTVGAYISGQVAGVISSQGLVGLFSWRVSNGTLEWFPDSALSVFDDILTAQDIDGTSWAGADAYSAATTGSPLYYFLWSVTGERLDGPVRRVLPEEVGGDTSPQNVRAYGVFVPLDEFGAPMTPVPAMVRLTDGLSDTCVGYISSLATVFTSEASDLVPVGTASLADETEWGPPGGASTTLEGSFLASGFAYDEEFPTAFDDAYLSGYFFHGWYDPAVGISDPLQNANKLFLASEAELGRVFLLDGLLAFAGGTLAAPNNLYLNLSPVTGQVPSVSALIEFTIGLTELTDDGTSSAVLAVAYTGTGGSTIVSCYGSFYTSMWISVRPIKKLSYNTLSNGTETGQFLAWDETLGEWYPTGSPLPDGTTAGQVLMWDGSSWGPETAAVLLDGTTAGQLLVWDGTGQQWTAGPYGDTEGQVLKWDGAGWTAGTGILPTGANKDTLFFDGASGVTAGWTANPILQWGKYVNGTAASTGGELVIDLSSCLFRAWDAPMPGLVIRHPSGGTCGVFANLETGADAGARLDMGWGGASGANFEIYANDHPTRPGEFRIIYGPTGHIEFKNFRGGSDWEVTSGITKEGRFFCGFNDSGFPGSSDTYGSYAAPAYPFQVFDETSHDSVMVAGISKEGRAFFGLGGTLDTQAAPVYPLEIYNESVTGPTLMAYISKDAKLSLKKTIVGESGSTLQTIEIDPVHFTPNYIDAEPQPQVLRIRPTEVVTPDGDGRVSIYKVYALTSEPVFDRTEDIGGTAGTGGIGLGFTTDPNDGVVLIDGLLKLSGTNETAPTAGSVWGYRYGPSGAGLGYGWIPKVLVSL